MCVGVKLIHTANLTIRVDGVHPGFSDFSNMTASNKYSPCKKEMQSTHAHRSQLHIYEWPIHHNHLFTISIAGIKCQQVMLKRFIYGEAIVCRVISQYEDREEVSS